MITSRVCRDGALEAETPFDRAMIEAMRSAGVRVWLDVIEPTDDELETLREVFDLHELAIEDSRNWGQRAKVEFYGDAGHLFLVAHGVALDEDDELVDSEVHLFAGRELFLITVRREPLFDFDRVEERLRAEPGLDGEGMGLLLYLLLDEIVDRYLDTVDRLEDLSDDIEDRVSGDDPGAGADPAGLAEDIFHLRREVVRFRRLVAPMREVVDLLMESPGLVTPALAPYYRDVLDHVIRATELIDNVRDLLTSARELQLAQVSNRLNVVMKQVTSWAAIILLPTLIAGIYGMNFRHIPELSWKVGYPMALGMMGLSAFVLHRVFRKRDWL
jgi:magnesium transporter